MKVAAQEAFGNPLVVDDVQDRKIGTGEVLVDVLVTCIPPYAAEVFSGKRHYPLEPPVISGVGAIGRVVAAGPDATRLQAPEWRSADDSTHAQRCARPKP